MALNQDSWQKCWQKTSQVWLFIMLCNSYLFQNVRIFHRPEIPIPFCLYTKYFSLHSPTPKRSGVESVGMHRSARLAKSYWKDKQSYSNYSYKAEKYGCNFIKLFAECWTMRRALQPKYITSQLCKPWIHYSHFDVIPHTSILLQFLPSCSIIF